MPFGILNLICNSKTQLVVAFSRLLMMMMISIGKLWYFRVIKIKSRLRDCSRKNTFRFGSSFFFFGMFSTLSRRYHLIVIIDSSLILLSYYYLFLRFSFYNFCDSFDVALFVAVSQTVCETLLPSFHIFSALTLHPYSKHHREFACIFANFNTFCLFSYFNDIFWPTFFSLSTKCNFHRFDSEWRAQNWIS